MAKVGEGGSYIIDVVGGRYSSTLIKKENKIILIYKEIQTGAVAKSYMRNCFLNMTMQPLSSEFPIYEENLILFFISVPCTHVISVAWLICVREVHNNCGQPPRLIIAVRRDIVFLTHF